MNFNFSELLCFMKKWFRRKSCHIVFRTNIDLMQNSKGFFLSLDKRHFFLQKGKYVTWLIALSQFIWWHFLCLDGEKNAPDIFLPIKMGFYTKIGIKDLPAKSSGHKTHQFPETENHMSIKLYTTSVSFYELS